MHVFGRVERTESEGVREREGDRSLAERRKEGDVRERERKRRR